MQVHVRLKIIVCAVCARAGVYTGVHAGVCARMCVWVCVRVCILMCVQVYKSVFIGSNLPQSLLHAGHLLCFGATLSDLADLILRLVLADWGTWNIRSAFSVLGRLKAVPQTLLRACAGAWQHHSTRPSVLVGSSCVCFHRSILSYSQENVFSSLSNR